MTLVDILKEYDKTRIEYAENGYGDTRKKLLVAFECLGLYDLEIFKSENGKDYCFVESGKEYIFYLLDRETSPLFRNIKGNKMTMDNYVELTEEVERLFEFVKIHTRSEEEYKRVVSEISSNVNYPIIKRHAKFQTTDYIFSTYYESMVRNDGMVTQISNWEYLTADDKAKLMDELIIATRKWVNLVERLGEYRADEEMEDIDNISIADIKLLAFVDDAISEEYCKKYYEMFKDQPVGKSRSLRSKISKYKSQDDAASTLKLDLAKKYCEDHHIDFERYLAEKKIADTYEFTPVSTEKAFEDIQNDI